jgi:hypothetical protein
MRNIIFEVHDIILSVVYIYITITQLDRLCGRWSEFLATDAEVPGSIPGATRFSEK